MSSSSTVEHVFLSLQFLGLDLHHTLPLPSLMAHNLCMIAIVILAAIINGYVFLSRLWVRRGQKLPAVFPCVHHHGRHSLAAGEGVNKGTDAPVCCLYPPGTRSTALRYRRCCYGNQDIGSTWAWGPHKTPWRRAHGKQDLREVQESHRFQGTTAGLDGSWPVGGRGDAVDPISAPTLSLQGRLPDFRWPQHLCIFAWGLSPVTSSAHAPKTGVWGIDSQPSLSGWWELAQKFPSSLDPRWNKGGLCVPYGSSGSLAGLSSRVLPCPDPQEEPVSPLGQASHTLLEGQKKCLRHGHCCRRIPSQSEWQTRQRVTVNVTQGSKDNGKVASRRPRSPEGHRKNRGLKPKGLQTYGGHFPSGILSPKCTNCLALVPSHNETAIWEESLMRIWNIATLRTSHSSLRQERFFSGENKNTSFMLYSEKYLP